MAKTVLFEFDALESCRIAAIDAPGFVTCRMCNAEGVNEYKVTYWYEGDRREVWFYEKELTH